MDELRGGSKVEGRRCWLAVGVVNNEPGGGCLMLGCLFEVVRFATAKEAFFTS